MLLNQDVELRNGVKLLSQCRLQSTLKEEFFIAQLALDLNTGNNRKQRIFPSHEYQLNSQLYLTGKL